MDWTTACPDWEDRVKSGRSLIPFEPLYPREAAHALSVFKALRMVDVAGQPTFGEVCAPWVFDYVAAIFGANDPETGQQAISEFFLLISKKNGKSTVAAGIMLTALIIGWRADDELLIIAPTIEIAGNSYKPAASMVRADPELSKILHVQDHVRTITHRVTRASLKVVAADTDTVGGKKAGRILVDELWLFGKRAGAEAMLREATGGMVSRPEGFVIYLSTQSDTPPAGVFKDRLDYARGVRDGEIDDPQFLPVIYEFPPDMVASEAYLDPANFGISNPNLGRSVSATWLERELKKETGKDAASRAIFLSKHLNIEIGQSLAASRWPGADFWEAARGPVSSLDELLDRCDVCTIGVDGGGLDDLFALAVIGRDRETRNWLHWARAWAQPDVFERRKSIAAQLTDFARDGDLVICEARDQDVIEAADICARIHASGKLPDKDGIGLDAYGVATLIDALASQGMGDGLVSAVGQGWKLQSAVLTLPRKLKDRTFLHCGQPIMAWAVGNAKTELRGSNYIVTKQAAGSAKIDPLMATFNAAMLMFLNPHPSRSGVSDFLAAPVMAFG